MATIRDLRIKAETLADYEHTMVEFHELSKTLLKENAYAEESTPNLMPWLIGIGVSLLATILIPVGFLKVLFFLAFIYCVYTVLITLNLGKQNKKLAEQLASVQASYENVKAGRLSLIAELNELRASIPEAAGKQYWWDLGVEPCSDIEGPGLNTKEELVPMAELSFSLSDNGVFVEDLTSYEKSITREELETLLASPNYTAIYSSLADVRTPSDTYSIMYMAISNIDPIEEVSKSTAYYKVDKQGMKDEFASKVLLTDAIALSLMNNPSQADVDDLLLASAVAVGCYNDDVNELPDEVARDYYRKNFNYLYNYDFLQACVVVLSEAGLAYLLLPRFAVPEVNLTFRAPDADSFSGRLESYAGKDPFTVTPGVWQPSAKSVIDGIFNDEYKEVFEFQPRNIFAPKPEGLTDAEWCYLIWKDRGYTKQA